MIGDYFMNKYDVDFRCLRYPGVISSEKYAFNGTACWSTQIFFDMLEKGEYKCFIDKDEAIPTMYIDDCIDATIKLIKADPARLTRSTYNLAGISLKPSDLAPVLEKLIPGAKVVYEPDFR